MRAAFWTRAALIGLLGIALPAQAESIGARYDIYTGGFKAIGIQARAVVTERTYNVQANLKTMGFLDWILRFNQTLEGRGRLGATTTPLLYLSEGTFFGTRRTTRLDYLEDGRIDAVLHPANEDDERTPVTDDMKPGTIDPLSVFVAVNRSVQAGGQPCSGRVPVYDGRRRFNIVLEDDGVGAVEASPYSVFSGPALRCKYSMERLAGFQPNPRFNARTPPVSILYAARFGESDLWVPVRLESDSAFGYVVGHLVEIDAQVRPLGRDLRPAP